MKTLFVALLALSLPAFAACPPGIPKIIGLDYHTARAKLISRGFLPQIPKETTHDNLLPAMWERGYLEGDTPANGIRGTFQFRGFTVETGPCEFGVTTAPCRVAKITCP